MIYILYFISCCLRFSSNRLFDSYSIRKFIEISRQAERLSRNHEIDIYREPRKILADDFAVLFSTKSKSARIQMRRPLL